MDLGYGTLRVMGEEASNNEQESSVASLHYFSVESIKCAVCGGDGSVIRVAKTANHRTLVTVMCDGCANPEIEGLLERGDMLRSADGTHLVSPALAQATSEALARIAERFKSSALPKKKKKKKKKKKDGERNVSKKKETH